ncbi:YpdA family putative bacillithiol disulfide reductase [Albibacterium sp.]|uniref:YpdA family putative bacillithiol disulfide reductase n=1 Tax=Albibacterium sp. TaxID=2952885 RepID=UPI002D11E3B7|nr:YpdA family putative bacillithiol disulfide reductase [Albibacterium sp.]HUH18597.1 YpdA family putative bacillithiol disulfide reductase [Albibacterium sp.]
MQIEKIIDLIIIGGGPIGLACGIAAKNAGLSYLIIEKGCLTNSLYNYPQGMTFFSTAERLEIGNLPFVSINPKPKRAEALEYYRRVSLSYELNIHLFEAVKNVVKEDGFFNVETSKSNYSARNIIVATGFYDIPMLMDIPGENLPKVFHYYQEPHYFSNQNVVVVGASNSSVDAALETFRKGANVTLIARGPGIGERVKYWVKPDIENRIAAGEIKAYFSSNLLEVRESEVDIETPDGIKTIPNDFVLALTGYQPNFEFLNNIGIELDQKNMRMPHYNETTMETNIEGIYLAGVVCGGLNTHSWFIENSRVHADQIIEAITAKGTKQKV